MEVVLLIAAVLILSWIYVRVKPRMRRVGPFLPDSYLFGIGLYTVGGLTMVTTRAGAGATEIALMSLVALSSALAGSIGYAFVCGRHYREMDFREQYSRATTGPVELASLKLMLLVSAFVCVLFIYVVLSNSIIAALLSVASLASDSGLLEARKAITAGSEGYLAPGYVKQFRDILIPVAVIALTAANPGYRRSALVWFALCAAGLGMLVSGQRLVFVVLFLSLLLGGYYARSFPGRLPRFPAAAGRRPWRALLVLVLMYTLLTVLLGRAGADLTAGGLLIDIFVNLVDRVFVAAPRENLATMAVWQSLGPTWGESWLADLAGALPGARESLANILHAATGGSYLGNSPLGLPADVWLAWGWPGLVIVPALYAFAIGLFDLLLLCSRSVLAFALKIYLFVVLPICYSPYLFVLYGGAAAVMLMAFAAVLRSGAWWGASASKA